MSYKDYYKDRVDFMFRDNDEYDVICEKEGNKILLKDKDYAYDLIENDYRITHSTECRVTLKNNNGNEITLTKQPKEIGIPFKRPTGLLNSDLVLVPVYNVGPEVILQTIASLCPLALKIPCKIPRIIIDKLWDPIRHANLKLCSNYYKDNLLEYIATLECGYTDKRVLMEQCYRRIQSCVLTMSLFETYSLGNYGDENLSISVSNDNDYYTAIKDIILKFAKKFKVKYIKFYNVFILNDYVFMISDEVISVRHYKQFFKDSLNGYDKSYLSVMVNNFERTCSLTTIVDGKLFTIEEDTEYTFSREKDNPKYKEYLKQLSDMIIGEETISTAEWE